MADKIRRFKTMVMLADKPGLVTIDTIECEGKLWLVPKWLEFPDERCSRPERMVRIDQFDHQEMPGWETASLLRKPIPTAVLHGVSDEQMPTGFEIRFQPDVSLPWSDKSVH